MSATHSAWRTRRPAARTLHAAKYCLLRFLNSAVYKIGKEKGPFSRWFHDVTSGNNSAAEFDAKSTPVSVAGFVAGTGWDADTGAGSPINDGLVNSLIRFVSPTVVRRSRS
jgi:hypothetical protein